MVGTHKQKQPEHQRRQRFKGKPGDADCGDVGEGEGLAQGPFGVAVHVGMQDVVEGAVLDADGGDQGNGERKLERRAPMEEYIAEDGPAEEQRKGPQPNPTCLLKSASANHGAKERPTPEKGVGPISLLVFRGISPWHRP